MSGTTAIEWTEKTWNPTTGCDKVSPGCDHCYALTLAKRLKAMGSAKYQNDGDPTTSGPGFLAVEHESELDTPLHWREPAKVFVNSMSDLFHDNITDAFIAKVFAVMALTQQHTYQVLTKRHGRMRSLLNSQEFRDRFVFRYGELTGERMRDGHPLPAPFLSPETWPLPNVWLGVSVETQKWADTRIPALLQTPAAARFLSCEPLLGPVDLSAWLDPALLCLESCYGKPTGQQPGCSVACRLIGETYGPIDWVIAGGESGPGARPMHPDWARQLRDQCAAAGVPFHYKQWGEWAPIRDPHPTGLKTHLVAPDGAIHPGHVGSLAPYGCVVMSRYGKKAAGRVLDGRTHDAYPTTAT